MASNNTGRGLELSRREFLETTGGALVGMAVFGLDSHRHNQQHTVHVTAAMYNGLTDIDQQGNIVPSIAESWEPNKDLTAWTFRLRKRVLFHNGREVDAEAIKLNLMRIKNPAIGYEFLRGTLENIESVDILDRYTVRLNANIPDVSAPSSVMPYPRGTPWHLEGIRSLEYDPDRAKTLLREARAVGTQVKIICGANVAIGRETAQVVQDLWNSVGFKASVEPLDPAPLIEARRQGAFDGSIQGNTYRYDPDDFFSRNLHSKSEYAQHLSGWANARYDRLVEEAKRTPDPARRKELYTEAWNIVNVELPHFYLHEVTWTSAAVKKLQGYQPGSAGALIYNGGGLRTAYLEA